MLGVGNVTTSFRRAGAGCRSPEKEGSSALVAGQRGSTLEMESGFGNLVSRNRKFPLAAKGGV